MVPSFDDIEAAACDGDLERIRILASRGANLNEVGSMGETLLETVISNLCLEKKPYRYDVVMTLLDLGADPNVLGDPAPWPVVHSGSSVPRFIMSI
jgi:ankyrin repeat protein